jgi:hypothetical protein
MRVAARGLEPRRLSAQDPKSCVSANFTKRPEAKAKITSRCQIVTSIEISCYCAEARFRAERRNPESSLQTETARLLKEPPGCTPMPKTGLEPARLLGHQLLKLARLPIPPLRLLLAERIYL